MNDTLRIDDFKHPFTDLLHDKFFNWWAAHTQGEPHMIPETTDDLRQTALIALFAFVGEEQVGASGIFPARTRSGEELYHNGQRIVEVGSNIIADGHRGHGIGKLFVERRIKIAQQHGWLPVSVTSNPVIHHIFNEMGATVLNGQIEFKRIRESLCICEHPKPECKVCPLQEHSCWMLGVPK